MQDEHFQEIKKLIEHPDFAWFYTGNVAHQKDTSDEYFTHTFFTKNNVNSQSINILQPLFDSDSVFVDGLDKALVVNLWNKPHNVRIKMHLLAVIEHGYTTQRLFAD